MAPGELRHGGVVQDGGQVDQASHALGRQRQLLHRLHGRDVTAAGAQLHGGLLNKDDLGD